MNCEDFESNVNELAREQIMEASVRAQALAHREECEACARRLEDQRSLSFKLRALAHETNSAKVTPLSNELLTALRSQQAATIRPARVARARYREMVPGVVAGVMAVAAMILVVIAVTVIRSRSVTPAAQSQPNSLSPKNLPSSETATRKTPDVVPAPLSVPLPNKNSAWAGRRVAGKNSRRNMNPIVVPVQSVAGGSSKDVTAKETATSVTPDSPAEITTDFMPVGYTSATNLQDGGQLVRVELPRSALVAFGLPMNVNRYDEKVKADVFFSADGMARAIRFVQ
jgi:hypothetical protein